MPSTKRISILGDKPRDGHKLLLIMRKIMNTAYMRYAVWLKLCWYWRKLQMTKG